MLQAIRIVSGNRDLILDTIPHIDPRDVDAMIQHFSKMDRYLVVSAHANRVSAEYWSLGIASLDAKFDYNRKMIQERLVTLTNK